MINDLKLVKFTDKCIWDLIVVGLSGFKDWSEHRRGLDQTQEEEATFRPHHLDSEGLN